MKWSEQTWESIQPVYDEIVRHPFILELTKGTLPEEKFRQYISQDSLYLAEFGRVLAAIASRAGDMEHVLSLIRFVEGAIVVERALHSGFFQQFGITAPVEKSPACFAYTHFLLSTTGFKNVEEALAAVLPCFWIYKRVGDYILQSQERSSGPNPYQSWIDTYSGEEFGDAVKKAIGICDDIAAHASIEIRERMTVAFIYSARLEWMFWDSAYRLEQWPV